MQKGICVAALLLASVAGLAQTPAGARESFSKGLWRLSFG